jgi:hypothetical protein
MKTVDEADTVARNLTRWLVRKEYATDADSAT